MSGTHSTKVALKDAVLTAEVQRGEEKKQWIAVLKGVDAEYQFDREFLAYSAVGEGRDSGYTTVESPMVVEVANGDSRQYWQVVDGEMQWVDAADEVKELLENPREPPRGQDPRHSS